MATQRQAIPPGHGPKTPPPIIQDSGQDLPFFIPFNFTLTANQLGARVIVPVENDADFEWRTIMANSTGLFNVLMTNNFIKRPLMPTPVNGENFAGTAQNPALLPIPWRLNRTTQLEMVASDRSGAPNVVQLVLGGYKKYADTPSGILIPSVIPYRKAVSHVYLPDPKDLALLQSKIPYWWPVFDSTIPSQQAQRSKFTAPDGSFVTHIVASSSQAAGFTLQLFDTEQGEIMEDSPVVNAAHCGTAQRTFWLRKVYKLPADGQLQCRVINLAAASNAVQVVLCGLRD